MLLLAPLALAADPAPRTPLPPVPLPEAKAAGALPLRGSPQLFVKLRDGVAPAGSLAVGATLRPAFHPERAGALATRAEGRARRRQPDFASVFAVDVPPDRLRATAAALAERGDVEVVWVRAGIAPLPSKPEGAPTQSFAKQQGYLDDALGVGARWAWGRGYSGEGMRISDVEFALNVRHEDLGRKRLDLTDKAVDPFEGAGRDHGTAVMGVVLARSDGEGVRGIASEAEGAFYPIYHPDEGYLPGDALAAACADSSPGDVVMVELQDSINEHYVPMETDAAVWMATRTCVDAGVVVVAAAGNGAADLDAPDVKFWRDRGDSGAILVGAGTTGTNGRREPEDFSNYGSRVDLQGWGSSVFTLGYGDAAVVEGDPNRSYTAAFSGTSSATPIVAGAALLVQQAAKDRLGEPLPPEELRELLRKTGKKQEGEGRKARRIGPLPDVKAAIGALDASPRRRHGTREADGGDGRRSGRGGPADREEPVPSDPSRSDPPARGPAVWVLGGSVVGMVLAAGAAGCAALFAAVALAVLRRRA